MIRLTFPTSDVSRMSCRSSRSDHKHQEPCSVLQAQDKIHPCSRLRSTQATERHLSFLVTWASNINQISIYTLENWTIRMSCLCECMFAFRRYRLLGEMYLSRGQVRIQHHTHFRTVRIHTIFLLLHSFQFEQVKNQHCVQTNTVKASEICK